jgi:hypothetical protein
VAHMVCNNLCLLHNSMRYLLVLCDNDDDEVDIFSCAGQNLTIGVSEVVEGSVLTGSARITKALVSSLQLGFGLAIGENLVWWAPKLEPNSCSNPNIPPSNIIIWSSLSSSSLFSCCYLRVIALLEQFFAFNLPWCH